MSTDDLWIESYNGEIYGAEIFQLLADRQVDPQRRGELEVLAHLERATKDLTAPVIALRGLDPGSVGEDASKTAHELVGRTWDEFLQWLERVTDHYLSEFYRPLVAASTDAEERRIAEALVIHEEALATYARRASGRESGDRLEAVYACPHMVGSIPAT